VWLLKRYLYKPILNAIDAREKRIAAESAAAGAREAQARKAQDEFEEKNKQFDQDRGALMAKAALRIKADYERRLDDARKEANALLSEQRAAARNDAAALMDQMMRLAAGEVFDVARRALGDLASVTLEERLGEIFTRRLREMKPAAKQLLDVALRVPHAVAVVRSRFSLATQEKAAIQNALNETFAADIRLAFETAPDGICGIELTVGGQRIAWTIAEYLGALEEKAQALISTQIKPSGAVPKLDNAATTISMPPVIAPRSAPAAAGPDADVHALAS
ncbi:MAG: F0F1 ATP synthase subunit B, partial [Steroidobacteraceae bacterium]